MKIKLYIIFILFFNSCNIIHNKSYLEKLDLNKNAINLKLNGYYYSEGEMEIIVTSNFNNENSNSEKKKIKFLEVFFLYENGLILKLPNIKYNTKYYCSKNLNSDNNYEYLHSIVLDMVNSHFSDDKKIKRNCDFNTKNIQFKGIYKSNEDSIKLQYYDSRRISRWNSGWFLQEFNGKIINDSTFSIENTIDYKFKNIVNCSKTFKLKKINKKPEIDWNFKILKEKVK